MDSVTVSFQFAVGEIVYFRTAQHDHETRPHKFMIVERQMHECSGGMQVAYKLQNSDYLCPEICLTRDRPEFDAEAQTREYKWVMDAIRKQKEKE